MSDAHGPEEATRESGSAVSVDDAPRPHEDEAEKAAADEVEEHDADHADDADDRDDADDDARDTAVHETEAHDDEDETEVHETEAYDEDDEDDDEDDDARQGSGRAGLFAAIGVAAVAVIGVLVLLAAFVWPNFTGPGKPDDTANQAVSALSSKDSGALDRVGCKREDGKPSLQLPPQLVQLVQSATPAGPVHQTLDSEARQTINLTLGVPGQPPQSAPLDMVLAENDGSWCLNNIEVGQ